MALKEYNFNSKTHKVLLRAPIPRNVWEDGDSGIFKNVIRNIHMFLPAGHYVLTVTNADIQISVKILTSFASISNPTYRTVNVARVCLNTYGLCGQSVCSGLRLLDSITATDLRTRNHIITLAKVMGGLIEFYCIANKYNLVTLTSSIEETPFTELVAHVNKYKLASRFNNLNTSHTCMVYNKILRDSEEDCNASREFSIESSLGWVIEAR